MEVSKGKAKDEADCQSAESGSCGELAVDSDTTGRSGDSGSLFAKAVTCAYESSSVASSDSSRLANNRSNLSGGRRLVHRKTPKVSNYLADCPSDFRFYGLSAAWRFVVCGL